MRRSHQQTFLLLALCTASAVSAAPKGGLSVTILTKDGQTIEGQTVQKSVRIEAGGKTREVALASVLSIHSAQAASESEKKRIAGGLAAVAGSDRKARDAAEAELTDIGLPAMSPLLATYKDTDLHEPAPLYRLFARLIPGYADAADRSLDLVRFASGESVRGNLMAIEWKLTPADGKPVNIAANAVRRIAVRRDTISKTFEVHALRHCTAIAFLDAGVVLSSASSLDAATQGFVRLSFDIDGWASDSDGLKIPGPKYKTNLVDGHPFGALVGRTGPDGAVWIAGSHVSRNDAGTGRLQFSVNDNRHWQNNIGSYRTRLRVTKAYDVGDAQ